MYATTTATELFFRQAVGRFVRWQAGRTSQKAFVFIPDDPRLRMHAFQIAEPRRHVLRPPAEDDDEFADRGELDALVSDDDLLEQLSLFSVLSSTATGISVHAVTEDGLQFFDDEPDPPDPVFAADPALAIELPEIPTEAGSVAWSSLSVAEQKDDLRTRNADVAKRLVDLTGWGHARSSRRDEPSRRRPLGQHGHDRSARTPPALQRELAPPPARRLTRSPHRSTDRSVIRPRTPR